MSFTKSLTCTGRSSSAYLSSGERCSKALRRASSLRSLTFLCSRFIYGSPLARYSLRKDLWEPSRKGQSAGKLDGVASPTSAEEDKRKAPFSARENTNLPRPAWPCPVFSPEANAELPPTSSRQSHSPGRRAWPLGTAGAG